MEQNNNPLQRFWFSVTTEKQWYDIMRECRSWFGKNWRTQGKVRKKLKINLSRLNRSLPVWFDVPDPKFATWVSVKLSIQVHSDEKYKSLSQ